jgi:hypothetical protein
MRAFVLFIAAIETLFWVVVVFRGDLMPRPLDPAGAHAFFFFLVLPAVALALWGRWLGLALGLVAITGFVYLSTVLAGFIAG